VSQARQLGDLPNMIQLPLLGVVNVNKASFADGIWPDRNAAGSQRY
jgi:hypothetical protein